MSWSQRLPPGTGRRERRAAVKLAAEMREERESSNSDSDTKADAAVVDDTAIFKLFRRKSRN